MKRRSFFGLTLGALVAPFLPKPKPLLFHPNAFAFVMAPLEAPQLADVLYGYATYRPDFAYRFTDEDESGAITIEAIE